MKLFDCPSFYNQPNIFASISDTDLQDLQFDVSERKIPFKPATTDQNLPIGAAFVALNAYCGADYKKMFAKPNFIVAASTEHSSFEKLFNVMSIHQQGVPELEQTALYYTNFVKVVLPDPPFQPSSVVTSALNQHRAVRTLFQELLRTEVEELIKNGCRIFVCLGKDVQRNFKQALQIKPPENCVPLGNNIDYCLLFGQLVFVLAERHFAWRYYRTVDTEAMVQSLAEFIEELQISSPLGNTYLKRHCP